MKRLAALLLVVALPTLADDPDWFRDWQAERAAERRHQETLQAIQTQKAGDVIVLPPVQPAEPAGACDDLPNGGWGGPGIGVTPECWARIKAANPSPQR